VSIPESTFVGNGHIYVLATGTKASEKQDHTSRSRLIVKLDKRGRVEDTVQLKAPSYPLALGVFPSGNMLLVSEDRLNHRVALDLVDDQGVPIRELRLDKDDLVERAAQLPPSSRGPGAYSPRFLISASKLVPWDEHLLLVPLETSDLPIIELGEHGVVNSVTPKLPEKMVLESFIAAGPSRFTVQLGKVLESGNPPVDSQGKLLGIGIEPSPRITEISRTNGSVEREIDLGSPGVEPACASGDVYRLLTSDTQRKLQLVTARVR
jgi:hypothetical protein